MPRDEHKVNRQRIWRPRFSLRTLAILVALVCAYFGAWEATRTQGVAQVKSELDLAISCTSLFPFVVHSDVVGGWIKDGAAPPVYLSHPRYFLWLFGPTIELPIKGRVSSHITWQVERPQDKASAAPRYATWPK